MNKNEKPASVKGKGAAVATVICFVAVIAMVGVYTYGNYQDKIEGQTVLEQETTDNTDEESQAAATNDIVLPEAEGNTSDTEEEAGEDSENASAADTVEETTATENAASVPEVWFDESSTLVWPASGAVIISYSMDETIYFPTLEQYKYNPALVIGGETGEEIKASAPGIVTAIEETAQTGNTITFDMGNGYSAVYGQLADITLSVGDYVNTGDVIGTLSEPTKYYSVEGTNLYFQVLKDGEPVDPLNFVE